MNLWQKLIEVRKEIDNFVKDTKGFGYQYVSGSQVLSKIRPKMDELRVLLKIETEDILWTTFDYKNSKGEDKTDFVIAGKVKYTWINADEPTEREECSFDIFGQQDDISKAYGSGLTYSERYFILKSLQAPTDNDDPDSKDTRGKTSSSQNQNSNKVYKCTSCGKDVPYNVANFSHKKYQKVLCMDCQKKV
ncbi:ERF family protein [Clostridium perfringens]|uniref:ERF family protein n=1 Tax=Clostridium perfringens TaxID=1502 RepID=UPI0018E435A3|nr:ERF family protein [Clostridium perfringens]MBI6020031.1 ERF family protein [Clostridium perfringens]MDM0501848.1 ERF family protein [Clostridium perfringens]